MKQKVLLALLLLMILLVGCNKNEVIIIFNIEENIIEKLYEKGIIIDENILNTITDEEVYGIYYEKEFTKEYNNEEIVENITLYIKLMEEETKEHFIYDGLTLEMYNQIIRDYVSFQYDDIYIEIFDDDVRFDRYIGVFDGAVVASYYNPHYGALYYEDSYSLSYIWSEEIEDIKLYHDKSNLLRVWKDGNFYTLKTAYQNKILMYEHIKEIANILYDEIDISKIDKAIKFNELCDYNDVTKLTFTPSYKWPLNISTYIRDKEVINYIINEFFISKNIELKQNNTIQQGVASQITICFTFKNLNNTTMRIHITESGKVYIGIGLNIWLESIDKVDINWEELENYINNLEN